MIRLIQFILEWSKRNYKVAFQIIVFTLFLGFLSVGCANRGSGPQGGPIDSIPPVLIKSIPLVNQTQVKDKKIVLEFDEIVVLENAAQKVVVSPPQKTQPIVKAISRKVQVELPDSLKPNTTYTIDFSDAIVDNNEKNKLQNFSFSFSTGDFIDSLQMRGQIIDASNLNPLAEMIIGIHSDLSDSAFTTKPFDRITKSDKNGRFTVRNIAAGSYRIYALADVGSNYMYDVPTEMIAFQDTIYVPEIKHSIKPDTIWREITIGPDSLPLEHPERVVDSIKTRGVKRYEPRSILLKAFNSNFKRQYLVRNERKHPYQIDLLFNAPIDSMPTLEPLNYDSEYLVRLNKSNDTITYWFTDTTAIKADTLLSVLTYRKTDSLNMLQWQTDTIKSIFRKPKQKSDRKRNTEEEKKINFLKIGTNLSSKFDVYSPINIIFDIPTQLSDLSLVKVEQKVDTLWKPINAIVERSDSVGLKYSITYPWTPEANYRLEIDSAAFFDLYGSHTNKLSQLFTIRALEEYSKLILNLKPYTGTEVLELLNDKDEVTRRVKAESNVVKIEYLEPGVAYMRLFLDENGNGIWDPGDYKLKKQAEEVYYFPYTLNLRAFWDIEEDWNYKQIPVLEQKPEELLPKDKDKK